MSSTEEKIMNILDDYDMGTPLTIDEKKLAFDRAKKFIETSRVRTSISKSMNILDTYMELTEYLAMATKIEEKDKTLTIKDMKYYHGKQGEMVVGIKTGYLKEALDEIDAGYNKSRDFMAKLALLEKSLGIELEVHNPGRHGCGTTISGVFVRYYKFKKIDLYNLNNTSEAE
jgi:hypothetical protein